MTYDPFDTEQPTRRTRRGPPNPLDYTWISDSKKKIAKRRVKEGTVTKLDNGWGWEVRQIEALGDAHPVYFITKVTVDGKTKHKCSCADHPGGEFRGFCTHSLAAMLHTYKEATGWDGAETTGKRTGAKAPATKRSTSTKGSADAATSAENSTDSSPPDAQLLLDQLQSRRPDPGAPASDPSSSTTPSTTTPTKRRRRRTTAPDTTSSPESSTSESPPSTANDAVPVTDVPGTWPSWLQEFRAMQVTAADEIVEAFETNDVVFFDGPTGSGKSLIAWMVAQKMQRRAVLASADKSLQDQYLDDFHEVGACTVKGRANYTPQIPRWYDEMQLKEIDVTCGDCTFSKDRGCDFCPEPDACSYREAKADAVNSPMAVLNYAYLIREAASARAQFTRLPLVVADECDVLESILLSQAEVVYSATLRRELKLGQPEKLDDSADGTAWLEWLNEVVYPKIKTAMKSDGERLKGVQRTRRLNFLNSKLEETDLLINTMRDDTDMNWVLSGYKKDRKRKEKEGPMIFKPVRVGDYGQRLLWRHGRKFLLMSATIVSPEELAETLGWQGPFAFVQAPMPFDVERREIHYIPVAKVTYKTKHEALPQIAKGVTALLNQWEGERAIIHTVSYELTGMVRSAIMNTTDREVFTYKDSSEKLAIIAAFEATDNAVLVGPSIGRGTDFKGDKARVNIICKVPYLSLGEQQVSARLHGKGGDLWYATKAVREIVQASGRTTRSEDDWGVTYILDASFGRLYKENGKLFPPWFIEAMRTGIKPSQLLDGRPIAKPSIHMENQI